MTILAAVAICVVLLVISFLAPSLSRHPQRGVVRVIGYPRYLAAQLPGPIGRWASKPFGNMQRYAERSAALGRSGRRRIGV